MYERGKAYFLSVWRGQRSLAVTFWFWYVGIVCVGISMVGAFLAAFAAQLLGSDEPYLWYFAAIVIGTVWASVGLWRCAARTGGLWSVLARLLAGLTLIGLAGLLAYFILQVVETI